MPKRPDPFGERCPLDSVARNDIKHEKFTRFLPSKNGEVNYALDCYKQIWDENSGYSGNKNDHLQRTIVEKNRAAKNSSGNSCFYFKYQEGMSLESAAELETRKTISKETSVDRKWKRFVDYLVSIGLVFFHIFGDDFMHGFRDQVAE
jgi:hypothetical protein